MTFWQFLNAMIFPWPLPFSGFSILSANLKMRRVKTLSYSTPKVILWITNNQCWVNGILVTGFPILLCFRCTPAVLQPQEKITYTCYSFSYCITGNWSREKCIQESINLIIFLIITFSFMAFQSIPYSLRSDPQLWICGWRLWKTIFSSLRIIWKTHKFPWREH